MATSPATIRRKRVPRQLAVIDADRCTGCQACIAICPADCIALIEVGTRIKGTEAWCEIDLDACIGCRLCIRLPARRGEPHVLTLCPWDAIEMVDLRDLPAAVSMSSGPPDCAAERLARLMPAAERLAALRRE
jgi:electron transport complex protein RnfB